METPNFSENGNQEKNFNYPEELLKLNYEYGLDLKSLLNTIEHLANQALVRNIEDVTNEQNLERIQAMARRAGEMIVPDRYENLRLFLEELPSKEEINLVDRVTQYW